jgi:hypothetical protein
VTILLESATSPASAAHQNAAAIDIGATMHVAAVGLDRTSDPVRSFGTSTADLHRLADCVAYRPYPWGFAQQVSPDPRQHTRRPTTLAYN